MGVQGNSEGGTDQVSSEGWVGRGLSGLWAGRRERVGGASRGCGLRAREGFPGMGWAGLLE